MTPPGSRPAAADRATSPRGSRCRAIRSSTRAIRTPSRGRSACGCSTMRARSRAELADALAARDVPDDAATRVLDRFTEVGLIDDAALAASLAGGPAPRTRPRPPGGRRQAAPARSRRRARRRAEPASTADSERARAARAGRAAAAGPGAGCRRRCRPAGWSACWPARATRPGLAYAVVREALAGAGLGRRRSTRRRAQPPDGALQHRNRWVAQRRSRHLICPPGIHNLGYTRSYPCTPDAPWRRRDISAPHSHAKGAPTSASPVRAPGSRTSRDTGGSSDSSVVRCPCVLCCSTVSWPGSTERQEAYVSGVWYAGIGAAFVLGLLFVAAYARRGAAAPVATRAARRRLPTTPSTRPASPRMPRPSPSARPR